MSKSHSSRTTFCWLPVLPSLTVNPRLNWTVADNRLQTRGANEDWPSEKRPMTNFAPPVMMRVLMGHPPKVIGRPGPKGHHCGMPYCLNMQKPDTWKCRLEVPIPSSQSLPSMLPPSTCSVQLSQNCHWIDLHIPKLPKLPLEPSPEERQSPKRVAYLKLV